MKKNYETPFFDITKISFEEILNPSNGYNPDEEEETRFQGGGDVEF